MPEPKDAIQKVQIPDVAADAEPKDDSEIPKADLDKVSGGGYYGGDPGNYG